MFCSHMPPNMHLVSSSQEKRPRSPSAATGVRSQESGHTTGGLV